MTIYRTERTRKARPTRPGPVTHEISRRNLNRATRVRLARAELRRALADGELIAADVIRNPDPDIAGMVLADLLSAAPGISTAKLRQLNLAAAREWVNLLSPVDELTERQIAWLLNRLPILSRPARGRTTTTTTTT